IAMARSASIRRTRIGSGKRKGSASPTSRGVSSVVRRHRKPQRGDRAWKVLLMRICIVGCGAVGSLFAAHLAKAGEAEVWAYDVWKEHTPAIRNQGLLLYGAAEFA